MIIYNKLWLSNQEARDQLESAAGEKIISSEEKVAIGQKFPVGFYTPNFFIRIGLFLLTCIILLCSFGLISLVLLGVIEDIFSGLIFFFGIGCYALLEYFAIKKHHFRSGVDDALLWAAGGSVVSAVNLMTNVPASGNAILICALAVYFTIRFADMLMAAIATVALLAVVFYSVLNMGITGKSLVSFALLVVSAVIYFVAKSKETKVPFYYRNCFVVIQITALVMLYTAVNYFVVRELGSSLLGMQLAPGQEIPLGWLFWGFTSIIPLVYILAGLWKKDVVLLRVGLLLVAAIVLTVRNYYFAVPLEKLMLFGGIIFTVLAWAVTKLLATPKKGFTSAEGNTKYLMDNMNVEALIIAETFTGTGQAPGQKFGGGSFGGGGASGEF